MLSLLRRIWRTTPQFHSALTLAVALVVLSNALAFVAPYVLKLLIDGLGRQIPLREALVLAAIGIASQVLTTVVNAAIDYRARLTMGKMEVFLQARAFSKLLALTLSYHEREATGKKTARLLRGADSVERLVSTILWNATPTAVSIVMTFFLLLWEVPVLAFAFAAGIPFFVLVSMRMDKQMAPIRQKVSDGFEQGNDLMTQSLLHVLTVQSFGREAATEAAARAAYQDVIEGEHEERRIYLRWDTIRMLIQDGAYAVFMLLGVYGVLRGDYSIGTFVFVSTVAIRALDRLFSITHTLHQIRQTREPAERLFALDDEIPSVVDAPDAIAPAALQGSVRFRDVSFSYPTGAAAALSNVGLAIAAGEQAAIVGPSGGGKSTFVKLLFRHYDPAEGAIEIDGLDIRRYARTGLRSHMGLVPQDVEVFDGTARENIAYADPSASMERVEAAARIANAHDFVSALPQGYDTEIGERGIKLSGGQRQRIGIARALLRNPAILVFDEATSHLDSESERLIHDALEKIRGQRTLIVIAHRLSTIQLSDKIFVLEGGRLVESGDHATLLKQGGLYRKLTQLQSLGAIIT